MSAAIYIVNAVRLRDIGGGLMLRGCSAPIVS